MVRISFRDIYRRRHRELYTFVDNRHTCAFLITVNIKHLLRYSLIYSQRKHERICYYVIEPFEFSSVELETSFQLLQYITLT